MNLRDFLEVNTSDFSICFKEKGATKIRGGVYRAEPLAYNLLRLREHLFDYVVGLEALPGSDGEDAVLMVTLVQDEELNKGQDAKK